MNPPREVPTAVLESLERMLREDAIALARQRPGEAPGRQPVHTLYGGAHLFRADAARRMGDLALASLARDGGTVDDFAVVFGLEPPVASVVMTRVREKLQREPVEDLRIDFEDGYGQRPGDEEDRDATRCGEALRSTASLPPFIGVRIKALTGPLATRAFRTLERLIAARGPIDATLLITLPKVDSVAQPAALAAFCDQLERTYHLPPATLRIELMIESPHALLDARGLCPLRSLVDACAGRAFAVHFGAYDFTAALGIAAPDQRLDHPVCDHARNVMQTALADAGVFLADGATNVLPVGVHRGTLTDAQTHANTEAVREGWRLHARHVRRSIEHGFHQSWDLHPAQLVSRHAAVHAFYARALPSATQRLAQFVERAAKATLAGSVFDDAATGQGLLNFFLRGLACGALSHEELHATGLTDDELRSRSFEHIVRSRARAG